MIYAEAATLAKEGDVKELWLTHYSPANVQTSEGLGEALAIFPNTNLGRDRMVTTLSFK